jgi:nucleotide-binding universal stress UspA family protein
MSDNFKILIAYDGSACADAALDDLRNAGLAAEGTEALIVSVAEVWLPPADETGREPEFVTAGLKKKYDENMEVLAKAKERAGRAAERVRANFPGWTVAAEATYGSPAWEILFRASDYKPDLIVVGSQGRSALERVLLGSVSQKIVTEAECPVRVARGRVETEESATRIVLGYDGSAGANETVKSVLGRHWKAGSEVKVLIVEDPAMIRNSLDITTDKFAEAGDRIVADLAACGLAAELVIKEGNPKHVVVEEAESWGADAIFVGAAKYESALTKYLLGSVSSAIVTRAHCTVEVVRPNEYGKKI